MLNRQLKIKLLVIGVFTIAVVTSCFSSKSQRYSIAASQSYEASLFRQNCAICHGPEAEGKILDDGRVVPNLRQGEFKYKTDDQIYSHISDGGNGMVPFKNQLTPREINLLVGLVQNELRSRPDQVR